MKCRNGFDSKLTKGDRAEIQKIMDATGCAWAKTTYARRTVARMKFIRIMDLLVAKKITLTEAEAMKNGQVDFDWSRPEPDQKKIRKALIGRPA
jgi:hypothetical protein